MEMNMAARSALKEICTCCVSARSQSWIRPVKTVKRLFKAITSSAKESGDKIIFRPAFDFIRCSGLNDFTMVHNAQAVSQIGS